MEREKKREEVAAKRFRLTCPKAELESRELLCTDRYEQHLFNMGLTLAQALPISIG